MLSTPAANPKNQKRKRKKSLKKNNMNDPERGGIKYLYFKRIPMPRLDFSGGVVTGYREVPQDPYDRRIATRGRPPKEPPVELAQNE